MKHAGNRLAVALLPALLVLSPARPADAASGRNASDQRASEAATPAPTDAAAQALARRVNGLLDTLRTTPGTEDRLEIADQLVAIGPDAVPFVIAEAERLLPRTWPVTIYILGAIGDPRGTALLEKHLVGRTGVEYQEILYALALAGKDDALLRSLRSDSATTNFEPGATAVDFIAGSMGPRAVPILVREIPRRMQESRAASLAALGTIGDASAVEFLLGWSRQPNALDRRFAVVALARIGDPRARARLLEALSDPDAGVREAAAEGIGAMRDPHAVAALTSILAEGSPSTTRFQAIWSLGLIGGKSAAEALSKAFRASPGGDQLQILSALGRTRDPAAVEVLAEQALSSDPLLALQAAQGLVQVPGERAKDQLLEVCDGAPIPDAGLEAAREAVARRDPRAIPCAVQRLRADVQGPVGFGAGAESLLAQLLTSAPLSAAGSLDSLAEEIQAPAIQYRLRSVASGIRLVHELGPDPTPWIDLLDTGTPSEVDLAVERLGELGDPRAVEPLRRLFDRLDGERKHRIPRALGRIGSDRATPFLISLLTDEIYRVPSLERSREEAARALASYTSSEAAIAALRRAFLEERGRNFVALLAYARLRGIDGIAEAVEMKSLLLRRRGAAQVKRNEKVVWALRMLRSGKDIPLDELSDPR